MTATDEAIRVLVAEGARKATSICIGRTLGAISCVTAVDSQRRLDAERQRGAALVAAVRAAVEAPAGGCNDAGVRGVLSAALAAYEGSAEA